MAEAAKTDNLQKICITLYGVYALSTILQFFEETILVGLLALTIAYIIGNSKKKSAVDTPYASHLRWMYRTFWIGSLVIIPVSIVILACLILAFTDVASFVKSLGDADPEVITNSLTSYFQGNMTKLSFITTMAGIPAAAWWIRRCWVGYVLAKEGKPVVKVTSWL